MRDDFPITIRDLVSVGLISDVKDGVKLLAKVTIIHTLIHLSYYTSLTYTKLNIEFNWFLFSTSTL